MGQARGNGRLKLGGKRPDGYGRWQEWSASLHFLGDGSARLLLLVPGRDIPIKGPCLGRAICTGSSAGREERSVLQPYHAIPAGTAMRWQALLVADASSSSGGGRRTEQKSSSCPPSCRVYQCSPSHALYSLFLRLV